MLQSYSGKCIGFMTEANRQRGNQLCVLEATLEIVKWPGERAVRERVARKSGAGALNTAV